jgi:dTDP-4-dehydrorhamnose 3,5-epimerase
VSLAIVETRLAGVLVLELDAYPDERGRLVELWRAERHRAALGVDRFAQDTLTASRKGVIRGLHFQHPKAQGKLVQVLRGVAFDVAVDVRRGSPTFGRWVGVELSGDAARQLWIPPGFAHGFCALTEDVMVFYKATEAFDPACDRGVRYDDPDVGIEWPVADPILSPRDRALPRLRDAPELPPYAA